MSKIIGISAGRRKKMTESVVRAVLAGTGMECDLFTLSGKVIRPCEACNGCVNDNICVLKDDFAVIYQELLSAEGLVFGAPTYWDHMNAKGQAFWERACFSGRHNALFPLSGKIGIIVGIDGYDGTGEFAINDIKRYFEDARIHHAGSVGAQGAFACFNCGYGSNCPVGGIKDLYPLGTPTTRENTPSIDNQHPERGRPQAEENDLAGKAKKLGAALVRAVQIQQEKRVAWQNRKEK